MSYHVYSYPDPSWFMYLWNSLLIRSSLSILKHHHHQNLGRVVYIGVILLYWRVNDWYEITTSISTAVQSSILIWDFYTEMELLCAKMSITCLITNLHVRIKLNDVLSIDAWQAVSMKIIFPKIIINSNLMKTCVLVTSNTVIQSFWNFAQSMAISLPCSVQNLKMIGQPIKALWANEILLDLSLKRTSLRFPILYRPPWISID